MVGGGAYAPGGPERRNTTRAPCRAGGGVRRTPPRAGPRCELCVAGVPTRRPPAQFSLVFFQLFWGAPGPRDALHIDDLDLSKYIQKTLKCGHLSISGARGGGPPCVRSCRTSSFFVSPPLFHTLWGCFTCSAFSLGSCSSSLLIVRSGPPARGGSSARPSLTRGAPRAPRRSRRDPRCRDAQRKTLPPLGAGVSKPTLNLAASGSHLTEQGRLTAACSP